MKELLGCARKERCKEKEKWYLGTISRMSECRPWKRWTIERETGFFSFSFLDYRPPILDWYCSLLPHTRSTCVPKLERNLLKKTPQDNNESIRIQLELFTSARYETERGWAARKVRKEFIIA